MSFSIYNLFVSQLLWSTRKKNRIYFSIAMQWLGLISPLIRSTFWSVFHWV